MSGRHRRRLTEPAQRTVYDLTPGHAPYRAPWPLRAARTTRRVAFEAFVIVFGSEETPHAR